MLGKQDFKDVEARFRKMGFDYVYPPNTPIECTLVDIRRAVGLTEPAVEMAEDVLQSAMDFYFEDQRPAPLPSAPEEGERLVPLPLSVYSKVLLLNEMLAQDVSKSELARRLETTPQEVQRITGLHHATKIDTVVRALAQLGKQLEIRLA